jgi:hypothetical protein
MSRVLFCGIWQMGPRIPWAKPLGGPAMNLFYLLDFLEGGLLGR